MGGNSRLIDLNRKRAAVSYENLKNYIEINSGDKAKCYKMKSCCRKLPMLIKTNGLIATLSFIKEKSDEYLYIYNRIEEWFNKLYWNDGKEDIIEKLMNAENKEYRVYTKEAIQISIWYKRNAETMINDDVE